MNRRELLGAVGLGATGTAGLLGTGASSASRDTETTTDTTTTDGEGFDGIDSSADAPFATVTVGTREGVRNPENNLPHAVRVWNDSDDARTVGLTLVRGGDETVLDRTVEFPADGFLTLRLLEPANYALAVRPGATTTATATPETTTTAATGGRSIDVSRARFDCNDSRTDVRVGPDGDVQSVTTTTEIGCPPAVVGRTFTAFRGSCGSANDAAVDFGAETVAVEGSIRAPNPCHGARLAGVAVPDADTLRVTVATTEPTADVCAECVGTVEYAADLRFRDRVPGTVEVVHRSDGETETVATVSRGETTTGG